MDLYIELQEKTELLDKAIDDLYVAGERYAANETAYRVRKAEIEYTLKSQGYAVSLISDICYRDETLADMLKNKILAESLVKVTQERINALKLRIKSIENQLTREYGR